MLTRKELKAAKKAKFWGGRFGEEWFSAKGLPEPAAIVALMRGAARVRDAKGRYTFDNDSCAIAGGALHDLARVLGYQDGLDYMAAVGVLRSRIFDRKARERLRRRVARGV